MEADVIVLARIPNAVPSINKLKICSFRKFIFAKLKLLQDEWILTAR